MEEDGELDDKKEEELGRELAKLTPPRQVKGPFALIRRTIHG
jgi:hypothetical protein